MTSKAKPEETPAAAEPVLDGAVVTPGTDVALIDRAELEAILGAQAIPYREWAIAVVSNEQYEEEDEEERALSVVKSIMLATTSEEVFAAMDMRTADDLCGKEPGGRSAVLEIYGARPLKSSYSEGAAAFAVVQAKDLAEGVQFSFSTGSRSVQAAIIAHQIRGWMPFRCVITRRRKPTQKGFYPLNLERGI